MFSCMLQQIDKALNPKKENLKEIKKKWLTLHSPMLIMMKKLKRIKRKTIFLKKQERSFKKEMRWKRSE